VSANSTTPARFDEAGALAQGDQGGKTARPAGVANRAGWMRLWRLKRPKASMAAPALILHVGPHKTGSTSLQHRLLNSQAYLNQHGFAYPAFGLSQFAHHRIYSFLKGDQAAAGDVTEAGIKRLALDGVNTILSSEDFIYLQPDRLQRLNLLLQGFRIEVILFVRTPIELWPSHWQELIKHGRDETLLEYLGAFFGLTNTIDARYMNPAGQAARFAQAFGREHVRIFCYNNIVAEGIDLFDYFAEQILHLPPKLPRQPTSQINKSLRPDMIELLRCLNERFAQRTGQHPQSRILAAYQRHQKEIEAGARYGEFKTAFVQHGLKVQMDSTSETFRRRDIQLMNQFGDRIENPAAADKLFSGDFKKTLVYGARYWTDRFGFGDFVDATLERLAVV
jgi:hypothetical protein